MFLLCNQFLRIDGKEEMNTGGMKNWAFGGIFDEIPEKFPCWFKRIDSMMAGCCDKWGITKDMESILDMIERKKECLEEEFFSLENVEQEIRKQQKENTANTQYSIGGEMVRRMIEQFMKSQQ